MVTLTRPGGLDLDPATRARMQELFAGRSCCRCAAPAARLCADRYYCATHYPGCPRRSRRLPRVYRVGTC